MHLPMEEKNNNYPPVKSLQFCGYFIVPICNSYSFVWQMPQRVANQPSPGDQESLPVYTGNKGLRSMWISSGKRSLCPPFNDWTVIIIIFENPIESSSNQSVIEKV